MNKNIKKIGKAVAGSALLVGATLTGAAGLASAAQNTQDLGDYPTPFVNDDGEVQSTIVVGDSAKTIDVVGAVNIAGSLGNAAFGEESVSVSGGTAGTWSADNGVTLDTRNDQLYFGDNIDAVRQTLTSEHLDVLSDTEFRADDGDTTEIEHYLYPGTQQAQFDKNAEGMDDEDPQLYVNNPADVDSGTNLFQLQANFEDGLNFTHADVQGEEIEILGNTYTVSKDSVSDELILFGSSEEVTVSNGEESTITVDGEEVTLGVTAVTSPDVAAIEVDGSLEEYSEDETFSVNGQEVRVDNIIQTSDSNSAGTVKFAIGSEEVVLSGGNIEDGNGDEHEGVAYEINGGSTTGFDDVSSLSVYVGTDDDDNQYVAAGESYSHPLFDDVEFRFGGLNPDAAEEGSEVEVSSSGDDTASVSFESGDDSVSLDFNHDGQLRSDDGEDYVVREGASVMEDDYVVVDAGDFSHAYEVTNIDRDHADGDSGEYSSSDEATVDLRDAVTGNTVEVDLQVESDDGDGYSGDNVDYSGTEVIDGQTYKFVLDGASSGNGLQVAWGDNSEVIGEDDNSIGVTLDAGDELSLYPALDTSSGSAVAMTEAVTLPDAQDINVQDGEFDSDIVDLGTTVDSSSAGNNGEVGVATASTTTGTVVLYDANGNELAQVSADTTEQTANVGNGNVVASIKLINSEGGLSTETITVDADQSGTNNGDTSTADVDAEATRDLVLPSTESTDAKSVTFSYDNTGAVSPVKVDGSTSSTDFSATSSALTFNWDGTDTVDLVNDGTDGVGLAVIEPENDNDMEQAYTVQTDQNGHDSDEMAVSGFGQTAAGYNGVTLESDDQVTASYDNFGAYSEVDGEDQGGVSLMLPTGQSTVGAAFTGSDGSLSAEGGAGSVTTMSPMGWPDAAALDSDSNIDSLKTSDELILVGGPAVNALTQELADDGKTMAASEYEEGTAMVQVVNDAFAEGQDAIVVAGYSGEDTRQAANYLANYQDNSGDLAGQEKVELSTQQTQSAE